ncbi:MAG: FtsX-like permease family protein [Bdellovibrionota bacterium]
MLLWKLALRNLFLHRLKTIVIGMIIVFGTTLAIVGNSIVDAISGGMQNSLTNSITGDIQIYSAEAKEQIAVLGSMDGNMPDIGHVSDFKKVKETLITQVPNIKDIIPMGINTAMLNPGNLLDIKLEELRHAFEAPAANALRIAALKQHLQAIIKDIERSQRDNEANLGGIYGGKKLFENAPRDIATSLSPSFWKDFDAHHEERIEFLANKMAPLIFDDNQLYLSYIGTVPELFQASFPQFEIASGEMIPAGARGFLFSDYVYENQVKHRVARRLDQIKKKIDQDHMSIKAAKELQDRIKANRDQAAEIYTQLEPPRIAILLPRLQEFLKSQTTDIEGLVKEFLAMDDQNFGLRYKFFYDEIAPYILLYRVKIGDTFAVTAFTKSGYSSSVNLKVYGTYRFKSFESSPVAGAVSIMDMVSFRKLFGFMTSASKAETAALNDEMGIKDLDPTDVSAMFGTPAVPDIAKHETPEFSLTQLSQGRFGNIDAARRETTTQYTRDEMENGIFLNAAIHLKDPSRLSETLENITRVSKEKSLGIQAKDWRDSAGMIGQLTVLVRGVLYLFVLVIFGVATFIIMNSMLMATLDRRREIGTMRAIGAQRSFLLKLFLRETFILSFVFGLIGTVIGVTIVLVVGSKGIPAMGDVSTFFFSGDRLYLHVNPLPILIVFVCMTLVSIVSTQYPAWRAMKISPLEAMQHSD